MDLEKLLLRSEALEEELLRIFEPDNIGISARDNTSYTMCSITLEHARSLRLLMGAGNFTSAVGMMRVQYEALVRAIWVFYAADDSSIANLSKELTPDNEKLISRLPMLSEMLKRLEKKAPQEVFRMLDEIKDQSWKAMNSFIHSGIHAVSRHEKGYPVHLIEQTIRHSNGMSILVSILLSILTNELGFATVLIRVQHEYEDCLHLDKAV